MNQSCLIYSGVHDSISDKKFGAVPRKLWAYWSSNELPEFIDACIRSWTAKNPDFITTVVTPGNLGSHIPLPPEKFWRTTPQRQSDWVRLSVLAAHGGIWLDASTIVHGKLDFAIDAARRNTSECVGYYLNAWTRDVSRPMIEYWFLAAVPNSPFIRDWMDEFRFSIESDPKEYVARLGKMFNIDVLRQGMEGTAMIEYANMTLAAQKLLMTPNAYRLCLMEAEAGPYKMCKSHGWEPERLGNTLCHKASDAVPLPILTKLRSKDWRPLQHRVENARAAILPTSVVGRMLIEH